MKQVVLMGPPNPDDGMYKNNAAGYNRAMYTWCNHVKGILEQESSVNNIPLGQNFVVGTYALNTFIASTSTGTDVTNFISSLVTAMTKRGFVSPKMQQGAS